MGPYRTPDSPPPLKRYTVKVWCIGDNEHAKAEVPGASRDEVLADLRRRLGGNRFAIIGNFLVRSEAVSFIAVKERCSDE